MYLVCSDLHLHSWGQFSEADEHGVNSRLRITLNRLLDAAKALDELGGERLYIAGDIFHTRDSLSPLVLNPTIEVFDSISTHYRVKVRCIPGNHDNAGRHTTYYGSSPTSLYHLGVEIAIDPTYFEDDNVLMVPWVDSIRRLKELLIEYSEKHPGADLIMHAPLNSVLPGLPDHGIDPIWLSHLNFNRCFVGHYHHYKSHFDRVYSIGSLTHQTFSDVGTKSGYLIVDGDRVTHHETDAPQFVDFDSNDRSNVAGNYVRCRTTLTSPSQIEKAKQAILSLGAKGVLMMPVGQKAQTRTASTVQAGASIQQSIHEWIQANKAEQGEPLSRLCETILSEAADAL